MKIRMLKRFAAALTAASITSVSLAMSIICPVSAVGGFAWLEWAELESLLQGIGFTSGNESLTDATIDYLEMTYDQIYQLTDPTGGGTAKPIWEQSWWDDSIAYLDHLVASWGETYDTVGSVGSAPSASLPLGALFSPDKSSINITGWVSSTFDYTASNGCHFKIDPYSNTGYLSDFNASGKYLVYCSDGIYLVFSNIPSNINTYLSAGGYFWRSRYTDLSSMDGFSFPGSYSTAFSGIRYSVFCRASDTAACSFYLSSLREMGWGLDQYDGTFNDWLGIVNDIDYTASSGFVGPVYSYPAAEQLAKDNDTLSGIRLDVKTADGVPDLQAALDGAGVDSVDDLVVGVADGSIPMQQVFADAKVTPYVLADTTTGAVVTDLGVAATGTAVKPVALTADLAVPSDLTAAATYAIQGKTWDPDMSKYKLPLFQYFPFCLPWDIYQVLSSFAADPVAPVITIPIGKFFANKKNIDGSAVKDYTVTVDLGEDKYSKWFSYLRLLESAGIIIGLVLISVKLIHGGR